MLDCGNKPLRPQVSEPLELLLLGLARLVGPLDPPLVAQPLLPGSPTFRGVELGRKSQRGVKGGIILFSSLLFSSLVAGSRGRFSDGLRTFLGRAFLPLDSLPFCVYCTFFRSPTIVPLGVREGNTLLIFPQPSYVEHRLRESRHTDQPIHEGRFYTGDVTGFRRFWDNARTFRGRIADKIRTEIDVVVGPLPELHQEPSDVPVIEVELGGNQKHLSPFAQTFDPLDPVHCRLALSVGDLLYVLSSSESGCSAKLAMSPISSSACSTVSVLVS